MSFAALLKYGMFSRYHVADVIYQNFFTSLAGQPDFPQKALCSQLVRSSVTRLVKKNELILVQIGTSDPRGKGMKRSTEVTRSKVEVTKINFGEISQELSDKF